MSIRRFSQVPNGILLLILVALLAAYPILSSSNNLSWASLTLPSQSSAASSSSSRRHNALVCPHHPAVDDVSLRNKSQELNNSAAVLQLLSRDSGNMAYSMSHTRHSLPRGFLNPLILQTSLLYLISHACGGIGDAQ